VVEETSAVIPFVSRAGLDQRPGDVRAGPGAGGGYPARSSRRGRPRGLLADAAQTQEGRARALARHPLGDDQDGQCSRYGETVVHQRRQCSASGRDLGRTMAVKSSSRILARHLQPDQSGENSTDRRQHRPRSPRPPGSRSTAGSPNGLVLFAITARTNMAARAVIARPNTRIVAPPEQQPNESARGGLALASAGIYGGVLPEVGRPTRSSAPPAVLRRRCAATAASRWRECCLAVRGRRRLGTLRIVARRRGSAEGQGPRFTN